MLGSTSNMTNCTSTAYVTADEVGKCHAIIRLAAAVPTEWRKHFPHGPEFLPSAVLSLASFIATEKKDGLHVVVVVSVARSNNWGLQQY